MLRATVKARKGDREKPAGELTVEQSDPWRLLIEAGVPKQVLADWKIVRDKKRAPLTLTALRGVYREADKARLTITEAITMSVEHSWISFKADWVRTDRSARDTAASKRVSEMTGGLANAPTGKFSR